MVIHFPALQLGSLVPTSSPYNSYSNFSLNITPSQKTKVTQLAFLCPLSNVIINAASNLCQ